MITVQLGVTAAVALIRLRAYAYAHDRRLRDVAGDVVARRLRFDPDDAGDDGGRVRAGPAAGRESSGADRWSGRRRRAGLLCDEGE